MVLEKESIPNNPPPANSIGYVVFNGVSNTRKGMENNIALLIIRLFP